MDRIRTIVADDRLPSESTSSRPALTVGVSIATGAESFSWPKILLIAGLVACVVGLKLVGESR